MKPQYLLICVGNIEAYEAERGGELRVQAAPARRPPPAPRPERNAPDHPIMEFNTRGWIFDNETNLEEFAEERLRGHPNEKLIKYSPMIMFETQPSPMIRKPITDG